MVTRLGLTPASRDAASIAVSASRAAASIAVSASRAAASIAVSASRAAASIAVSASRAAASIALASLLLTACPCDSGLVDFFADELREDCDGLPCGWTLTAGHARFVPFLHSGDGALELEGTLERSLDGFRLTSPVETEAQVYVLARCDSATELVVSLEVDVDPPRSYEARLPAGTPTQGLPLPRHQLPLTLVEVEDAAPLSASLTALRALALRVEGPGRCRLSDLHLVSTQISHCF